MLLLGANGNGCHTEANQTEGSSPAQCHVADVLRLVASSDTRLNTMLYDGYRQKEKMSIECFSVIPASDWPLRSDSRQALKMCSCNVFTSTLAIVRRYRRASPGPAGSARLAAGLDPPPGARCMVRCARGREPEASRLRSCSLSKDNAACKHVWRDQALQPRIRGIRHHSHASDGIRHHSHASRAISNVVCVAACTGVLLACKRRRP